MTLNAFVITAFVTRKQGAFAMISKAVGKKVENSVIGSNEQFFLFDDRSVWRRENFPSKLFKR